MTHRILNISATPVLADVDVLIIGAGSAGCCAAIAARQACPDRQPPRVMLIERYGFPGGSSTGVLDTFYGFFTPGEQPRKVVGGIPDRIVDALHTADGVTLRPNTYGAGQGITYNPERLKHIWDTELHHAGVDVLMHTMLVDVSTTSDGRIDSVIVFTKGGFKRITARRFIDASGDADLCHWAEVPYEKAGTIDPAQTLTTTFRLANVDLARFEQAGGKTMLQAAMTQAVESGTHPLPRKAGSFHAMVIAGCVATVAARIAEVDATDSQQLSAAEREGRRQAFIYERFLRGCVPGYENARIAALSTQIGVRETRRVYGEYRLTREDCLSAKRFDDRIMLCGAPIEDHRPAQGDGPETAWAYVPEGRTYDVPYRTLVARGRDELWVAGRCFSATHDAHASCRSMGQTMSMGQAAGTAAALSLAQDCSARDVPITSLQTRLLELGAVLDFDSAAPAQKAWKERGAAS